MELTKIESALIEVAIAEAAEAQLRELNTLQLASVGGGIGEASLI
jgi:hypothetical protein